MTAPAPIQTRKLDHLEINLRRNVEASGLTSGFERLQFVNSALPEMDLNHVQMQSSFLGKPLNAPILISSMTGGIERGWQLTRRLASAAQEIGCALAVGSQRAALETPELARYFQVRSEAPDIPIYANLGAVQLNYGYDLDDCRRVVEMIEADGLFLHLNPLQEVLQEGGNTNWSNLATRIESVCRSLEVPVIAKEVGFGISAQVARMLSDCGVAAIDVSGAGGTSWSAVEHLRCATEQQKEISRAFLGWGIPTARCLVDVSAELPDLPLLASGGMRTGVDAAKALALGASLVGIAGPLLRAAERSQASATAMLQAIVDELRITMFAAGARTLDELGQEMLFDLDTPILSNSVSSGS